MAVRAASFDKLLVANRSEIACRVFQACRELGIRTVGIYAPGDEDARHVTYADEIQPVASYLSIPEILEAANRSGATLIHPGYGFLSERPEFARAVEEAGMIFVGPCAETMELLGGKIAAKELADRAQVPTLPWARVQWDGQTAGPELAEAARWMGYPVLLKASAGGGGRGMRRVNCEAELQDAASAASAEAKAAFGDGALLVEKLVEKPRHIEVQVFGDGEGGVVHYFERECSLQRRYQKIWEEAPAPRLSEELRQAILASAQRLASLAKYRGAGTVEFLLDGDRAFYFLEMNTRLQVEHPVSEMITGCDLVRAQIQCAIAWAEGKSALPEVGGRSGHAIEVRLYAEDPANGFIPSVGKIDRLRWPTGAGIRVESGIEEGQRIGVNYDAMLAKIIVHGQDRVHAISRLRFALGETIVFGVQTNQAYLRALCDDPRVREGSVHTGFLAETPLRLEPSDLAVALIGSLKKDIGPVAKPVASPWIGKGLYG